MLLALLLFPACVLASTKEVDVAVANMTSRVVDDVPSEAGARENHIPRNLGTTTEYETQLYFDLQYVNDEVANQMESADSSNAVVAHFCTAVQQQVLGDIVADAMSELNSSISIDGANDTCKVLGTAKIYNSEAENIFGTGYVSLQIHVSQRVNVTSDHFLWTEEISSIVEGGFKIQTGGQSQFRIRLHENSVFDSVLTIELRRGLASPEEHPSAAPTPTPSPAPTPKPTPKPSPPPTREPTGSPSHNPTDVPTESPSFRTTKHPSNNPTGRPTSFPTLHPSESPTKVSSHHPTRGPSANPTPEPSMHPSAKTLIGSANLTDPPATAAPFRTPTPTSQNDILDTDPSQANGNGEGTNSLETDTIIIAALAGGMATLCVSCSLMSCIWWRKKRVEATRRTPPKHALTSRDAQQKHDLANYIPGIVELDQQSLADTTLGEQTAGPKRPKPKKKRPPPAVQPLDSFDEQSLYTTPFSVREDEGSPYIPAVSHSTSALSDQIIRPFEYEGNMLLPISDASAESSDGIYSAGPLSERSQMSISEGKADVDTRKRYDVEESKKSGPIDLDTDGPYLYRSDTNASTPTNNETLARQVSKDLEEGDVDLDPYGGDEWSCDFEDFDRGSDFYADEAISRRSRSPSQSSKSTSRIGNISSVLGDPAAPEEDSHLSYWSGEEEKKDVDKKVIKENEPFAKVRFGRLHQDQDEQHRSPTDEELDKNAAKLYRKLMLDNAGLEKPSSPTSHSSKKSLSSRKSATSFSSRGSRKTQVGQPPRYPMVDSRLGPSNHFQTAAEEKESSFFPITLSKLFNAVASPDSKGTDPNLTQSTMSIPEGDEDELPTTDQSSLKEDDASTLLGIHIKDDVSASSASTGMSPNPWLFDTVEQTLGPRSVTADMESLSGKSNISVLSPSKRSTIGSETSYGSRMHARSDVSTPRSELVHDLKRLELQLAALDNNEAATTTASLCASSITGASLSTVSTRNRSARISRKKRIIVLVPPGKLGVILANRHDGKGTVVSEVREHSALRGMLAPGDKLVAVDGEDVTGMVVSQITSLMASKAERERRLTVITSVSQQYSKPSESRR